MNNTKLFIILGNQLFNPNLYFKQINQYDFFLCEDYGLCSYVKHHKLKLLHVLSSMRLYKDELKSLGLKVHYNSIEDENFYEDYLEKLKKILSKNKYKKLFFFEIEDKFFEKKLLTLNKDVEIEVIKSPMFLFGRNEFNDVIKKNKKPMMANFYKYSRKKLDILMDEGKPLGGKWSFDEENRKKLPKGVKVPKTNLDNNNKYTNKLSLLINKIFENNIGSTENNWLPADRKTALKFLDNFLLTKFSLFGDYEDALSSEHDFLFHSALSPILNLGLITPAELLSRVKKYQNKIKINSYEGFIRQVIGWREFIRGVYQKYESDFTNNNYFHNNRKMKQSWYEGKTGIFPLDDAITKARKFGWNHHIERLMVIANIMNIARINPKEVYKWFMEFYVDSYDWVMVPNVFGMGLYSDGGVFATKPYICASSYILKMSDYKKGEWTDIVDGLYWKFIDENREKLRVNPRIGIMTKMIDTMDKNRKNKIYLAANKFIEEHTF